MEPYLKIGDILAYQPQQAPQFGELVIFSNGKESVIHRYLGPNSFKGDAIKRFDQEYDLALEVQGVATHRMVNNTMVSLNQGFLVRMLSFASSLNHANYPFFHRFYAFLVNSLGRCLRKLEVGLE